MSKAELDLLRELLELNRPRPGMSLEERRAHYDRADAAFASDTPEPEDAARGQDRLLGKCSGLFIDGAGASGALSTTGVSGSLGTTRAGEDRPVVLYLHGGSYTMGSSRSHRHLAAALAGYCDADTVVLDYRRPAEDAFPAAVEDAVHAYRVMADTGRHGGPVVLAGDSAGAGLALAATQVLRDEGDQLPAAVLCFSPWTDLTCELPSHAARAERDPLLRTEDLRGMAELYRGGRDPRDPLASPLFADFEGFPPLLIQVGSEEILRDDARLLADRAREAGVEVDYEEWPGMFHVWQYYYPILSEGRAALEAAARFTRARAAAVA